MPREINFNFKLRLAPILGRFFVEPFACYEVESSPEKEEEIRRGKKSWCPSFPALLSIHSREDVRDKINGSPWRIIASRLVLEILAMPSSFLFYPSSAAGIIFLFVGGCRLTSCAVNEEERFGTSS